MMRKKIKVGFADMWQGMDPCDHYAYRTLAKRYDVELSDRPEYLICGQSGHRYLDYDCIKIILIGENVVPDFNQFDYGIGFDHLTFGDRYLRMPLCTVFPGYDDLKDRDKPPSDEVLLNRKFCSFVVSNGGGNPMRRKFFEELSKYKRVDSGGLFLNNVGGSVPNKKEFCRGYKFNIAFENSASPGYTTEKVMEPLSYFSVPIYWGNALVGADFREEAMVCVRDEADMARAIDEIIYLDSHDDKYLAKAKMPCLVRPHAYYWQEFEKFLYNIVDQPLELAARVNRYGYQAVVNQRVRSMNRVYDAVKVPYHAYLKARRLLASWSKRGDV